MILGRYIISDHAVERYNERVGAYRGMSIRQSINKDLHFTRIKKIVTNHEDDTVHVFTRHSKEFIFIKDSKALILRTVIKRSRDNNKRTINKRRKNCKTA